MLRWKGRTERCPEEKTNAIIRKLKRKIRELKKELVVVRRDRDKSVERWRDYFIEEFGEQQRNNIWAGRR